MMVVKNYLVIPEEVDIEDIKNLCHLKYFLFFFFNYPTCLNITINSALRKIKMAKNIYVI